MKIRFGALALVAMLAACSSQDQTETGNSQKGSQASATSPGVGAAISGYSNDSKRTLGNAPDRGELFGYKKDAAVLHKGAYTLRPIALSEEHALRGVATGMMTVPGPNGEQIKIRYQRHEESPDGNWSWIGRVVGGDAGREAIITFGEHAVFGSIPQADGTSLQLTTERGIAYLVQADVSRLVKGVRAGGDTRIAASYAASGSHEADSLVASAMRKVQAQALAGSSKAVPAANTVDLVAGYSNGLATRLGGPSVAVTKLVSLVAAANAALTNSNVNGKIRLVSTLQVSYADNTDNGAALNELTGNNGTGPVTVPASLAPLRAARETYGADLVTLVRDFKSENNGCGIAWLLGANQEPITIAGDAPFAYSVISEGSYDQGGSTYYCEDITMAHEMAHNMGSAHDVGNAGGNTGRYPYSYGYKTAAAQGNFFTVMAYGDDGQTLYRVFSNPLITTCGSLACGVTNQADNARSLNQTIPVAATFRAPVVPFIGGAINDFDGNGKSDILWRNTAGNNIIWKAANSLTTQHVSSLSTAWKVAGVGDFSGDGKADILWRNGSANAIWRGGLATSAQLISSVPSYWLVAGVGDFDGDGRADILWRNGSSNVIWKSGIASTQQAVASLSSAWAVAGIGDFDASGTADILWRNSSTGGAVIWKGANASTPQNVTSVPSYWSVAGVGDFDGDGRSDILWRNTGGNNTIWKSGNSSTQQSVSSVATYWKVVGTGDFDGDGRADIHWRTGSSNVVWKAAIASSQLTVATQPNVWAAQPVQ